MHAFKSVKQRYRPSPEILELLEAFRAMVNDCIRIGLKGNTTSIRMLSLKAYHQLETYNVATCYRLTAISKASSILRNYHRSFRKNPCTRIPNATKLMLTDCYGFRIEGGRLRLTIRRGEYVYLSLNNHTEAVSSTYTPRSITLTAVTLSIAYSKENDEMEPVGLMGIDRNLDNITIATSFGEIKRYYLSLAARIKATYREVKSHFGRNDVRLRREVYRKYGTLESNRVKQILHHASKDIVNKAKTEKLGIVMENLKGIRKLYRKGGGQGRNYRARLNSWSFYELQRQVEYKARWEGIPVHYVPPHRTSSSCAICGSQITECAERRVWCHQCRAFVDRDENAARNILAKGGLRFGPVGRSCEAVKRNGTTTLILGADGRQSRRRESCPEDLVEPPKGI